MNKKLNNKFAQRLLGSALAALLVFGSGALAAAKEGNHTRSITVKAKEPAGSSTNSNYRPRAELGEDTVLSDSSSDKLDLSALPLEMVEKIMSYYFDPQEASAENMGNKEFLILCSVSNFAPIRLLSQHYRLPTISIKEAQVLAAAIHSRPTPVTPEKTFRTAGKYRGLIDLLTTFEGSLSREESGNVGYAIDVLEQNIENSFGYPTLLAGTFFCCGPAICIGCAATLVPLYLLILLFKDLFLR